jgi:hypothetical protein
MSHPNACSTLLLLALLAAMLLTAACTPAEAGPVSRYFAHVLTDGDYLNDWLTHMSEPTADVCLRIGQTISPMFN